MTRYTPCQGKCQLLGAVNIVILQGKAAGSPGVAWGTGCSLLQRVPRVPMPKELLSEAQEKAFLQGSRYFAPGKWCHVFPATDKVKPLIWLKI